MSRSDFDALPIARLALRVLVVLNWAMGAAILVLLLVMPHEQWILKAFGLASSPDSARLIAGMRTVAVIGLVSVPLNYVVLTRLRAIVETVRAGDPFVAMNAQHLRAIAWTLLVLQLLALVVGRIGEAISTRSHPVHFDAGFSVAGWLAVLLTFVLARVFTEGARMRDDVAGTV